MVEEDVSQMIGPTYPRTLYLMSIYMSDIPVTQQSGIELIALM